MRSEGKTPAEIYHQGRKCPLCPWFDPDFDAEAEDIEASLKPWLEHMATHKVQR